MKNFVTCFTSILQLSLLFLLFSLNTTAMAGGDSEGYYWYHNRVSAYPTGKGLVYAVPEGEGIEDESSIPFTDEITVKFCSDSDQGLVLYQKANEGYGFNGWYNMIEGRPDTLITLFGSQIGGFLGSGSLHRTSSDDNESEYYSEEPDNNLCAVFGRVNHSLSFEIEDYEMTQEKYAYMWFLFYRAMDTIISIDNPSNELGDQIRLSANSLFEYYSVNEYYDIDYEEDSIINNELISDTLSVERFIFKGWKDSKGNIYTDSVLTVIVTEPETYVAHYVLESDLFIVAGNFYDSVFRSWLLEQDYGKDGVLTITECDTIRAMNISSQPICYLNGISYFGHLIELDCSNTLIEEFDELPSSLERLICNNNRLGDGLKHFPSTLTYFECCYNGLDELSVDYLIEDLPDVQNGTLVIYGEYEDYEDQNCCTERQVADANAKGWRVMKRNKNKELEDYSGPTELGVVELDQQPAASYYGIDGKRLQNTSSQPDIYIINGRKKLTR